MRGRAEHFVRPLCSDWMRLRLAMNMLKISKAIFRSLLSSRSLCVVVVALMVLCALPVFRSAAGIDGRVEYLESGITRVEQELSASYADALVNAGEDGVYTSSSSMPALLYPLAAGRLILAPLSPLLPFLQISDGEYPLMTDRRSTCYGSQRPLPSRSLPRVLTNVKSSSSRHRWASWVDLLHRAYGRVFLQCLPSSPSIFQG